MKDIEKKLSEYIDKLNTGNMPDCNKKVPDDDEFRKLTDTVRRVKALHEVEYPEHLYQKKLIASLIRKDNMGKKAFRVKFIRRGMVLLGAAAAAAVLLFVSVNTFLSNKPADIVYAMEKAMKVVKAYHGIIEVTETNELGETMTQSKREVWADRDGNYYIKELDGYSKGMVTVNNGDRKWQLRPEEKTAYIFSTFPDPYRFTFELGNEINDVKKALTVKTTGEDVISKRVTTVLEVTPEGGETYRLWIDNETELPLQKQSAMQNALQYKVSYSSIEFLEEIPQELLNYSLPAGFAEVDTDPEQVVTTIGEADSITGFGAKLPETIPEGYTLNEIAVEKSKPAVKLYYGTADKKNTVILSQTETAEQFAPAPEAILGTVNHNAAEIISADTVNSIRWQEQGMEYSVLGNAGIEKLTVFAEGVSAGKVVVPQSSTQTAGKPKVEVPVDMSAEENEQKSVDAGHSPWKLDPVFVTQVFASLLLSPEGIVGDYPIPYEDITILENNGTEAKAEIRNEKSIAKYVYLKRLVRQDDTGIWTVVGYDPANQQN